MKQIKLKNLLHEAIGNTLNEATVTAIDMEKMTAIAELLSDENRFPELDGQSLNPNSRMDLMKDTIDVIVELPKFISSDKKKFWKWVGKMHDKYGSDEVIQMHAENADQIEDSKLRAVFIELEEALDDLDTCFAEPLPRKKFVKAYESLATAVDKVLAASDKINPITEAEIKFDPAAERVLQSINNELRAGAVLQKAGNDPAGDDFIVFRKAWAFLAQDLPKYIAILSDYPKATMGMHREVPGVPSIKLIK